MSVQRYGFKNVFSFHCWGVSNDKNFVMRFSIQIIESCHFIGVIILKSRHVMKVVTFSAVFFDHNRL